MKMSELLPCPFCGCEAEIITTQSIHGGDLFGIMCKYCCSRGDFHHTKEQAIDAWNSRVKCYPESLAQRMIADGYEYELFKLRKECDKLKELNGYHAAQYELASEDCDRLQAQVDKLSDERYRYKLQCERYEEKIDKLEILIEDMSRDCRICNYPCYTEKGKCEILMRIDEVMDGR